MTSPGILLLTTNKVPAYEGIMRYRGYVAGIGTSSDGLANALAAARSDIKVKAEEVGATAVIGVSDPKFHVESGETTVLLTGTAVHAPGLDNPLYYC